MDPVWPDNEEVDELEHVQNITPGQRAVHVTMLYAREVDNGGMKQFLSNSSSMYYQSVLEGLDLLGAGELYESLKQVLGYLPNGSPSSDWEERRRAVAAFSSDQRTAIRTHRYQAHPCRTFQLGRGVTFLLGRYMQTSQNISYQT